MSILNFTSEIKEETVVSIQKNIEVFFDFVAIHFLQNYRNWSPEVDLIESLSAGELALTVTQFDPPHYLAYGYFKDHYQCQFLFESLDGPSTRLTFGFLLEAVGVLMRPFSELLCKSIREGIEQTTNDINQLLNHKSVSHCPGT